MKKIVVLGSGMVGRVLAADLAADFEVTAVDVSQANLDKLEATPVKLLRADLASAAAIGNAVRGQDLVVGADEGAFRAVMDELASKNIVYRLSGD